jgi:hypothetical protein
MANENPTTETRWFPADNGTGRRYADNPGATCRQNLGCIALQMAIEHSRDLSGREASDVVATARVFLAFLKESSDGQS